MFGHDLDAPILHRRERDLGQRLDGDEPLRGDHRLDDLSAALGTRDGGAVRFGLDDESRGFHVGPQFFAGLELVLTLVRAAVFVDLRGLVEHRDDRQVVTLRRWHSRSGRDQA